MPETHFKSQPKSLKAPTFIKSIRSIFSLRRHLGCSSSSSTAIEMAANMRPRTQSNTITNRNNSKSSKKNVNFLMKKQKKVVVVAAKNCRRHRQQQLLDLADVSVEVTSPSSPPTSRCDTETSGVSTVALGTEVFQTGIQRRRYPHPSPVELAEALLRQTNMLLRTSNTHDQFRDWRLDTDDMTYEQLLALGDKIGHVSTGLKDSEILRCVKKIKLLCKTSLHVAEEPDKKCSICQEEYEAKDKLGLLMCEHSFHRDCLKQWLRHKKICPVCKTEVLPWL